MFYFFSHFVCCFFNKKENYNNVGGGKYFSRSTETVRCTVCLRLYITFTVLWLGPSVIGDRTGQSSWYLLTRCLFLSLPLITTSTWLLTLEGESGKTRSGHGKRPKTQKDQNTTTFGSKHWDNNTDWRWNRDTEINTDRPPSICIYLYVSVCTDYLYRQTAGVRETDRQIDR